MSDFSYVRTPAEAVDQNTSHGDGQAPRVAVFGAGIAGLTAAHELAERGFKVTVYEPTPDERRNKSAVPNYHVPPVKLGGLAASQFSSDEDARLRPFPSELRPAGRRPRLPTDPQYRSQLVPGEHGFRFFPSYYRHLWDMLRRIPQYEPTFVGNPSVRPLPNSLGVGLHEMAQTSWYTLRWVPTQRTVYDNVVSVTAQAVTTPHGRPSLIIPRTVPSTVTEWLAHLAQYRSLGFAQADLDLFQGRLLAYMATSPVRRAVTLENISAYDYLVGMDPQTAHHSVNYTAAFDSALRKMPKILAAFDCEWGDARTNINTFLQLHLPSDHLKEKADGVLNGPTSESWFDHWYRHLSQRLGVSFVQGRLVDLKRDRDRVVPSVSFTDNDPLAQIPGLSPDLAAILMRAACAIDLAKGGELDAFGDEQSGARASAPRLEAAESEADPAPPPLLDILRRLPEYAPAAAQSKGMEPGAATQATAEDVADPSQVAEPIPTESEQPNLSRSKANATFDKHLREGLELAAIIEILRGTLGFPGRLSAPEDYAECIRAIKTLLGNEGPSSVSALRQLMDAGASRETRAMVKSTPKPFTKKMAQKVSSALGNIRKQALDFDDEESLRTELAKLGEIAEELDARLAASNVRDQVWPPHARASNWAVAGSTSASRAQLSDAHPFRKYKEVRDASSELVSEWAAAADHLIRVQDESTSTQYAYVVLATDAATAEAVTSSLRSRPGDGVAGGVLELDGYFTSRPPRVRPRSLRDDPKRPSLRDRLDQLTHSDLALLFVAQSRGDGFELSRHDLIRLLGPSGGGFLFGLGRVEFPEGLSRSELLDELASSSGSANGGRGLVNSQLWSDRVLRRQLASTPVMRFADVLDLTRRELIEALIPLSLRTVRPLDIDFRRDEVRALVDELVDGRGQAARLFQSRARREAGRLGQLDEDAHLNAPGALARAVAALSGDELRGFLRSVFLRSESTNAGWLLDEIGIEPWDRFQTLAGVQFFFDTEFQLVDGHVYYGGSEWALTSVNQTGLWSHRPTLHQSEFGSVLSVIVGDWRTPSSRLADRQFRHGRSAAECTSDLLAEEVWNQICEALANDNDRLDRSQVFPEPVWYSVDQYLALPDSERLAVVESENGPRNRAPYLVPIVDDWNRRPGGYPWDPLGGSVSYLREDADQHARRGVWMADHGGYEVYLGTLVFAGTWTRTFTRMTTMESACESGRHAVNAILDHWIYSNSGGEDARPIDYSGLGWPVATRYVPHDGGYSISQPTPAGDYCRVFDIENDEWTDVGPLRQIDASYAAGETADPFGLLGADPSTWTSLPPGGSGSAQVPLASGLLAPLLEHVQSARRMFDALGRHGEPGATPLPVNAPPGWTQVGHGSAASTAR